MNDANREKPSIRRKTSPSETLSTTNPIWTSHALSRGLRSERHSRVVCTGNEVQMRASCHVTLFQADGTNQRQFDPQLSGKMSHTKPYGNRLRGLRETNSRWIFHYSYKVWTTVKKKSVKLIGCVSCSAVTQTLTCSAWKRTTAFGMLLLFYWGTLASPKYFVYCNSNGLKCASTVKAPCAYLPVQPYMSVILS